jgi:hypothetical protein
MTWSAAMPPVGELYGHTCGGGLTVHMGHEYFVYMGCFEILSYVLWGLRGELSYGSFGAVNHCIIMKFASMTDGDMEREYSTRNHLQRRRV